MISGQDFVVLSDDFHGLPTSCIHLCKRLARRNRVFWFNTVSRLPSLSLRDAGKVVRTLSQWFQPRPRPTPLTDPVHVVSPVMVPWFRAVGRRFNRASWQRTYRRLQNQHGITRPIVVTTFPFTVDFVQTVEASARVYYCVDDFLDYPGVAHAEWTVMEAQLLAAIDGLVVTSRELGRTRRTHRPMLHLPHGVDLEHFQEAVAQPRRIPALEALPHPIVGFFGLLSEWFDQELLLHLARRFPNVSFVLLGRSHFNPAGFQAQPNVHYLGWVPYEDLPHYARYFDVGLIPYVQNQMTRSLNPLKLMEYFALGLPVLATRLPELEHVPGPLRLASGPEEFAAALQTILDHGPAADADDALAVARDNTWDQRVERLSDFLASLVGQNTHLSHEVQQRCTPGLSS
jgi:glycosyltransferase involved in cell wall biosynthesis